MHARYVCLVLRMRYADASFVLLAALPFGSAARFVRAHLAELPYYLHRLPLEWERTTLLTSPFRGGGGRARPRGATVDAQRLGSSARRQSARRRSRLVLQVCYSHKATGCARSSERMLAV